MTFSPRHTGKLLLFAVALLTASPQTSSGFLPQEQDVVKKEYVVRPGGTLNVDMDRGTIIIGKTSGNKVLIELTRTARAESKTVAKEILAQHNYTFEKNGNDVSVSSNIEQGKRGLLHVRKSRKLRIETSIRVPEHYNVTFSSGSGNIDITEVKGRIKGHTGAGNIVVSNVHGIIDITSGTGNIHIDGEIKKAMVKTGAGNVELYGSHGEVDVNTGTGNIMAIINRQPREDASFQTGAGNVEVQLSDDIHVYVNATTGIGAATCEFPSIQVSKNLLKQSFSGNINGEGGPQIHMSAGVGNVTLSRN